MFNRRRLLTVGWLVLYRYTSSIQTLFSLQTQPCRVLIEVMLQQQISESL